MKRPFKDKRPIGPLFSSATTIEIAPSEITPSLIENNSKEGYVDRQSHPPGTFEKNSGTLRNE